MKWVLIFLVIVVLILVIVYNIINQNENKALYYPSKRLQWKPEIDYRSVYLNVNDRTDICSSKKRKSSQEYISAWHFNNYPDCKTVLFCHGNTGNVTNREYIINICHKFKLNLLVFDYRGYGKSDSFPHKKFLKEDGEIAYEYLHYKCGIPHKEIIVWGESLGGISSSWVASKYPCAALILICTFSSLDDAITYRYEGSKKKAMKMLTDFLSIKMDMVPIKSYLAEVQCPVVIMHSTEDEMIPYACSWINYNSIQHHNKLHLKIKGGHASPDIKSHQLKQLFEFCNFSLDGLSSDLDMSQMLEQLRTFAAKHNNFMSM